MNSFRHIERIEAFVEGRMQPEEKQQFEVDLKENETLQKEYQTYLATLKIAEVLAYKQTEHLLPGEKQPPKTRFSSIKNRNIFAIAAGFLLLLFISGSWLANRSYSDRALFNTYYKDPNLSPFRGGINAGSLFQSAADAYEKQAFDQVARLLDTVQVNNPGFVIAQNLLGHAMLHLEQSDKAISAFDKILATSEMQNREDTEWNLALSYLKKGDVVSAKIQLNSIAQTSGHTHQEPAVKILKDLDSFWRKFTF